MNERIRSIEMPATKLYLQMPAAVLEILLQKYVRTIHKQHRLKIGYL